MRSIKHSKYKNTGILFELLVRQISSDVLEGNKPMAHAILKKFFHISTELGKEYSLYHSLMKERFSSESQANEFLNRVIASRKKINEAKLLKEKYSLVRAINESYDTDMFFNVNLPQYRTLASIYKVFLAESSVDDYDPGDYTRSRFGIVEHITRNEANQLSEQVDDTVLEYRKMDKDQRFIIYKLMIDKFNSKYSGLNKRQKALLSEYINNFSDTSHLKEYILAESKKVAAEIKLLKANVDDKVIRIKLQEAHDQLDGLKIKGRIVDDEYVTVLLNGYELVQELKKLEN